MPGAFRKIPTKSAHKKLPASPTASRPSARPAPTPVRRSTNLQRLEQRNLRKESLAQIANQVQNRPRPTVRPAAPPQRIMPQRPAPAKPAPLRPASARPVQARPALSRPSPSQPSLVKPGAARPAPARPQTRFSKPGSRPLKPPIKAAAGSAGTALVNLAAGSAHAEIASEVAALNSSLEALQRDAVFTDIQSDITNLDNTLNNIVQLLESARSKGYLFQKDLDEGVYQAMGRWQALREEAIEAVNQQSSVFQNRLLTLNLSLQRLNSVLASPTAAVPVVRSTQSQVNTLKWDLDQIQRGIEQKYESIETQVYQLNGRLTDVHWALEQLAAACFHLQKDEYLVMAVPARWDKEGKDDPEGVLYLTDQRLVFERKEKVATKKVLFITTASELVQDVQIDQPLSAVRGSAAENKGLFGHHDFLQVEFADPRLGKVSLHLSGQESKEWHELVSQARSGQLETNRVSGASLSMAELSRSLTQADLLALQQEVNELQDEMMLRTVQDELSQLENELGELERKLAQVRARGYAIEKDLEADLLILNTQWDRVKKNAVLTLEQQTRLLTEQMQSIQQLLSQFIGMSGNLQAARPLYLQLKSAIASAEAQADAAENTVLTQFDEYEDEVQSLSAHLDWVHWTLEALATASFRLLATESGVAAVEAQWARPGLEAENGILFLTDQRLLWEDRVEAYELKLEVPLQFVREVRKEVESSPDAGTVEFLAFSFGPGAPLANTRVQLSMAVADDWLKMVGRARSGGYAQDRAVPLDPAELERIRLAPQQCDNCGAALTTPILRGQNEIRCEYCGKVIRI